MNSRINQPQRGQGREEDELLSQTSRIAEFQKLLTLYSYPKRVGSPSSTQPGLMSSCSKHGGSVWYVNSKPRRSSEDSMSSAYALNVAHTMQHIEGNPGQSGRAALTTHDTDIYDIPDNGSDDSPSEFYDRQEEDDELLSDGSEFSDSVQIYDDVYDEVEAGHVDEQIYEIDIFEGGGAGTGASSGATHGAIPVSPQGAWSSTPSPIPKTFSVTENKSPRSYENVKAHPPPPPPVPGLPPQVAGGDVNQAKGVAYKGKVALKPPRKQRMKRTESDSSAEQSRPNPNDSGIEPPSPLQISPHSTPSDSLANELTSRIAERSRALSSPTGQREEPSAPTFRRWGSDTVHIESDRMNPTPKSVPIADELAMKLSNRIRALNMGDGTTVDVQSNFRHRGSDNSSRPDQTVALARATNLGITEAIGGRELYHNVDIQHGFLKDQEREGCPISPSHERVGQKFDPSKSALHPAHGRRRSPNEENGTFNVSLRDAQDNAPPIPKVPQKKKALVPPHLPTKDAISFEPRSPVMAELKMAKQPKSPAPKPAPKPPVLFDETYENTEIRQPDVKPMSNSTNMCNTQGGVEQDIQIPRKYLQSMAGTVVFNEEAETILVERTDLQEYLHVGDQVLQIAGIDVRNSCAAFVTECWKRTSENPVRIKVLRR